MWKKRSCRITMPHNRFPEFSEVMLKELFYQPLSSTIALHFICSSVSINLSCLLSNLNKLIHLPYVNFPFNHHLPWLDSFSITQHEGHWQTYPWISFWAVCHSCPVDCGEEAGSIEATDSFQLDHVNGCRFDVWLLQLPNIWDVTLITAFEAPSFKILIY